MKIEILGSGCAKCNRLTKVVEEVLKELKNPTKVDHVKDMGKILDYGVMMTPGVVIDGKVKSVGRIPDRIEIIKWINEAMPDYSVRAGALYDDYCAGGEKLFREWGGDFLEWTPEALAEMENLYAPAFDEWIAMAEGKGHPAKQGLDDFYTILQELGVEKPAIGYTPGG